MPFLSRLQDSFPNLSELPTGIQQYWLGFGQQLAIFGLLVAISMTIGHYTPFLVRTLVFRLAQKPVVEVYKTLVIPLRELLKSTGTLVLITFSSLVLENYPTFYRFLRFFLDLAVTLSFGWLASRLFRQYARTYGVSIARRSGRDVDELLLAIETLTNVAIGFITIVIFAQSQRVNLVSLLASLGLGGLAIAFAAQKTLEQVLGTVVLYLDRPFVPGEYIRFWNWPAFERGLLAKVESIGLRSTKVRSVARGTLIVLPNSLLANLEIENVTRSKKVMVLLYLDFTRVLGPQESAFVEQVVRDSTVSVFGVDSESTRVTLFKPEERLDRAALATGSHPGSRARISFFILGASEDSLQLRKRLLQLANEEIAQQLLEHSIQFSCQEPSIYIESPVTI